MKFLRNIRNNLVGLKFNVKIINTAVTCVVDSIHIQNVVKNYKGYYVVSLLLHVKTSEYKPEDELIDILASKEVFDFFHFNGFYLKTDIGKIQFDSGIQTVLDDSFKCHAQLKMKGECDV